MVTAAPTIVTIEANSAWVVIVAVSLVTFPAALSLRRLIGRPGALASSLLLGLPLGLPLIAAAVFQRSVLPEVSILRRLDPQVLRHMDWNLLHLLFVSDGDGSGLVPYVLSGAPGRWLLFLGAGVSFVMLLRRLAGTVSLQRLIKRGHVADRVDDAHLLQRVAQLSEAARLKSPPALMLLPRDVPDAFTTGVLRGRRIFISESLVDELSEDEIDGLLAHELAHVVARDVGVIVLSRLLRDVVVWNPVAHLALHRLIVERELEADRCAATLTGKPLAVASSLLKVCEFRSRHSCPRAHLAVAFWRRRGPLKRRVANLLALADGRVPTGSAVRLPYLVAACVAAVLGLQVGAQVARQADFAILWGAAETPGTPFVFGPGGDDGPSAAERARPAREGRAALKAKGSGTAGGSAERFPSAGYPAFGDGYVLREKDLPRWMKAMTLWAKRNGFSPRTLAAEVNQSWRAVRLFAAPTIGPFGFYRIDLFPTRQLPGPQR